MKTTRSFLLLLMLLATSGLNAQKEEDKYTPVRDKDLLRKVPIA